MRSAAASSSKPAGKPRWSYERPPSTPSSSWSNSWVAASRPATSTTSCGAAARRRVSRPNPGRASGPTSIEGLLRELEAEAVDVELEGGAAFVGVDAELRALVDDAAVAATGWVVHERVHRRSHLRCDR